MKEYTPDTIDDVRLVLRGLEHSVKVEIEPGIPLAAKTVRDLRARDNWPAGLRLIVPDEPGRPESAVKVERQSSFPHLGPSKNWRPASHEESQRAGARLRLLRG